VYPDFAVWEDIAAGYVYPFIFTSDSDWTVDVCAQISTGYRIVGVYDENGNLVSDARCSQAFVSGETKALAFEVVETGSPEPRLNARLRLRHHGRVNVLDLDVPGIRIAQQHAPGGPLASGLSDTPLASALLVLPAAAALACIGGVKRRRRC